MLSLFCGLTMWLFMVVTFPAGYVLLDSAEKRMKKQPAVFTGRRALKILFGFHWASAVLFVAGYILMLVEKK